MKNLYFFKTLLIILIIPHLLFAFGVGDYVAYPGAQNSIEHGTIIAVLGDKLKLRPHRSQGDFTIAASLVKLVKDAQSLRDLQPKAGEYSINLMWVKAKPDGGKYIFRDKDVHANLAKVVGWAKKNLMAKVVVWYDGAVVDPKAVSNTSELLDVYLPKKVFPEHANQIVFENLRNLPETWRKPNHEVFSEKMPVYFRVDLLRVMSAYHTLKDYELEGKRHSFVYADIDVAPMSKEELFDFPTQMDLDQFGIVMARGGIDGMENSFQIWSNNKPNLLKAAKAVLIDANILRAKYVLAGGSWKYSRPGNTDVMPQEVYNSYWPMFRFYYHLEGFGEGQISIAASDLPLSDKSIGSIFGLNQIEKFELNKPVPEITWYEETYLYGNGRKYTRDKIYYPTKIIDAPESTFLGQPTRFDPQVLTPNNYKEKLTEALKNPQFDNSWLHIATSNNDIDAISQIAAVLSPQELVSRVIRVADNFSPLSAAIEEGRSEAIKTILKIISPDARAYKNIINALSDMKIFETPILERVQDEETKRFLTELLSKTK